MRRHETVEAEPRHTSLDLNIERMRAKIHQEMADACRPFMERLRELDIVDTVLKRELADGQMRSEAETPPVQPPAPTWKKRFRRVYHPRKLLRPAKEAKEGIYKKVPQKTAIIDVVNKEPGLDLNEITKRLEDGGYPFRSSDHIAGMFPASRDCVLKGQIIARQPTAADRASGIRKIRYYPLGRAPEKLPEVTMKFGETLVGAILTIIADGPEAGLNRNEIMKELQASNFPFPPKSKHGPAKQVSWSVQALVDSNRISRHGHGPGALFTRPKLVPTLKS